MFTYFSHFWIFCYEVLHFSTNIDDYLTFEFNHHLNWISTNLVELNNCLNWILVSHCWIKYWIESIFTEIQTLNLNFDIIVIQKIPFFRFGQLPISSFGHSCQSNILKWTEVNCETISYLKLLLYTITTATTTSSTTSTLRLKVWLCGRRKQWGGNLVRIERLESLLERFRESTMADQSPDQVLDCSCFQDQKVHQFNACVH